MKFKTVQIGEYFFENSTGEFYKKISNTDSVVVNGNYTVHEPIITCKFPTSHDVEEIED